MDELFNPLTPAIQPWYWRLLPLAERTGSAVFAALFRPESNPTAIATLLESPYPTSSKEPQLLRYSICAGAPRLVDGCQQMWTPSVGKILPFLQQLMQMRGGEWRVASGSTPDSLPFTGGWLGWLGYDLAWEIERLPSLKQDLLPFPIAYWYEPECFAILDHWDQTLWLATTDPQQLDELESRLEEAEGQGAGGRGQGEAGGAGEKTLLTTHYSLLTPAANYSLLTSQEDYEASVRRAKKYIQAGDIFQANLSLRFEAYTAASSWRIYRTLQQINPSPFASYWQTPWGSLISCSPERLVQGQRCKDETFRVSTRPIAGTRARGVTSEQDRQLAQDLITNAKERAEHIMLVDLERNDLGRVCQWGSVVVDELLTTERYSHVMHLVSNITGTLRPEYNAVDLIRALFPGGTISGCPKVRCMEIIEELEPVRRNLFYGSCGYLDWRGNLDLNILIRTLLFRSQEQRGRGAEEMEENPSLTTHHSPLATRHSPFNIVWGQVGAGIVADSDPEREWYESLHKAQAQLAALRQC